MPPPDTCPTCGQPWPDEHDHLADELAELYGPDFTPPEGDEGEAST